MTNRDRRALVLGGSVVSAALLLLRVLPWTVRSTLARETALQQRVTLLARARADLSDASVLRDSAAQLSEALVGLASKILSGETPADAASDLSGRINLAASTNHAKLERTEPVADSSAAGRLHRSALRAAFECDVRGLAGVLRTLALGKVALSIRELRVTAVDPGSPDKSPELLRVEMTVVGWYLGAPDTGEKKQESGP